MLNTTEAKKLFEDCIISSERYIVAEKYIMFIGSQPWWWRLFKLENASTRFLINQVEKYEPPVIWKMPNDKLIENMCLSYKHDFGLLDEDEKNKLRFQCKEWLRAYENNQ